jgi:acetolactate synthase regulatory subunit
VARVGIPFRRDGKDAVQLQLQTTDSPDVLLRVLTTLRRRGCTITSVDYAEGDRHRPGRLEICLRTAPRTEHRIEAWLAGLVEVEGVRVEASPLRAVA